MENQMYNKTAKRYLLATMNRTYLNAGAVFSDETSQFLTPYDPEPGDYVTFRLRTAKDNVEQAYLNTYDNIILMIKTDSDELFDYYEVQFQMKEEILYYHYSVQKNGRTYYYNKRGLYEYPDPLYHFRIVPGFKTPDWAKGAVMYQIFLDRFCNGDPFNDPVDYEYLYLGRTTKFMEWDAPVEADDICNFYGGDLQGLMDKMSYLRDLGIEAIYLNPIHVSPSSHKYDIQDYDYIDPHFGVIINDDGKALTFDRFNNRYATKYMSRTTDKVNLEASNQLFIKMVELAHANGIKVILDGVFNHCGSYNKWLDKAGFYHSMGYPEGAYRSMDSPYHKYFLWFDQNWPNNDCYDGWWGNDNHPKLNFEDAPELYEYIMEIGRKWVSPPFNADGWRLDVAADLGRSPAFNHKFWKDFRKAVKSANPNAIILAEHYGDVSSWISGGEWDTVMNYDAFMEPLTWFLTGVNKHSEEHMPQLECDAMSFENAMRYHMAQFNIHALQTSMNQLSNHDHSRFLTRTNRTTGRLHTRGTKAAEEGVNKDIMLEALVFQMTWPGAPTVYYGDEAGLCGWHDPDNRRPFPWGKEDKDMLDAHKATIAMRKQYPVLRTGSVEFLWSAYGVLSFGRWNKHERVVVILNNNPKAKELRIPVWKIGCANCQMEQTLATYGGKVHLDKVFYQVDDGTLSLKVPEYGSLVLVSKK